MMWCSANPAGDTGVGRWIPPHRAGVGVKTPMAVTLRLVRLGRTHRAFFRLRAADSRSAATGPFIEELGFVDPLEKDTKKQAVLKTVRIEYWLRQGAKVSPTVKSLLKKHNIGVPAKSAAAMP